MDFVSINPATEEELARFPEHTWDEVDVEKKGFKTVGRVNRTGTTKPGLPVEINFTVASSA